MKEYKQSWRKMKKIALILAGGRGKRFWPHSRFNKPKQLLSSPSGNSMLRDTFERLLPFFSTDDIYIATIEDLFQPIKEMVPEIDILNYIIEPVGRDTAASIALSTLMITHYQHDDIDIAIFPIDHFIPEKEKFQQIVNNAFQLIHKFQKPVIMGIKPKRDEKRYGYICTGKQIMEDENQSVYQIRKFKEKPNTEWIEKNKKEYQLFWNSGIYFFPGKIILSLFEQWMPQLYQSIQKIAECIGTLEKNEVIKKHFKDLEYISFEYGILEKIDDLLVIEGQLVWEDIGSWHAIERFVQHDANGNIIQGEHEGIDTNRCIIINDQGLTVTIGLSDLVIINNGPIQLIYPKNREGDIKNIINQMAKDDRYKKYL
ncbi:MAG: mannose-1-phosphate guanylyltransferase [Atribacterota bacterium]